MSYFDDPKNKAAWDKELAALKKEKEARISRMAAAGEKQERSMHEPAFESERDISDTPTREKITYAQLLMEESMAIQAKKSTTAQRTLQKEASLEM